MLFSSLSPNVSENPHARSNPNHNCHLKNGEMNDFNALKAINETSGLCLFSVLCKLLFQTLHSACWCYGVYFHANQTNGTTIKPQIMNMLAFSILWLSG